MSSQYSHPFNPDGVLAYFISFRCHGTWLHGDEKGSMDRLKNNRYGASRIAPDPNRAAFEYSQLHYPPVSLNNSMRQIVEQTIREVCQNRNWLLYAVNAQKDHVHVVVVSTTVKPEKILNDFKIWCTRRLRENQCSSPSVSEGQPQPSHSPRLDRPIWSRHGSTVWLWTEAQLVNAVQYTLTGQGEPPSSYRETDLQ